jgi:hypothetical protein
MGPGKWLKCEDPEKMLQTVRIKKDKRKLRLFAVACARRLWQHLIADASRAAIEFAEGTAEAGKAHRKGQRTTRKESGAVAAQLFSEARLMRGDASFAAHMMQFYAARAAEYTLEQDAWLAAYSTSMWAAIATGWTSVTVVRDGEIEGTAAHILRRL